MKVYLSEERYIQLVDSGSITVGDITIEYNEEDDYLTPVSEEIDSNKVVTIDTEQTISGKKTFSSELCLDQNGTSSTILKMEDDSTVLFGNEALTLKLIGAGVNPTYKNDYLALKSELPTIYTSESGVDNTTKTLRIYTDASGYLHIDTE